MTNLNGGLDNNAVLKVQRFKNGSIFARATDFTTNKHNNIVIQKNYANSTLTEKIHRKVVSAKVSIYLKTQVSFGYQIL